MKSKSTTAESKTQSPGVQVGVRYITNVLIQKLSSEVDLGCIVNLNLTLNSQDNKKIKFLENLEKLTNLRTLKLSHNIIERIEHVQNLSKLEELYAEDNNISRIDGLQFLPNLRVLVLAKNRLPGIPAWLSKKLRKLQELNLADNTISSLHEVSQFSGLGNLVHLFLSGNPAAAFPHYEDYVVYHVRSVSYLDGALVTAEARNAADARYSQEELKCLQREKEKESRRSEALAARVAQLEGETSSRQLQLRSVAGRLAAAEDRLLRQQREIEEKSDRLEKNACELGSACLKQYQLEQELAFFKLDLQFDAWKSPEIHMAATGASCEQLDDAYIGKSTFQWRHATNAERERLESGRSLRKALVRATSLLNPSNLATGEENVDSWRDAKLELQKLAVQINVFTEVTAPTDDGSGGTDVGERASGLKGDERHEAIKETQMVLGKLDEAEKELCRIRQDEIASRHQIQLLQWQVEERKRLEEEKTAKICRQQAELQRLTDSLASLQNDCELQSCKCMQSSVCRLQLPLDELQLQRTELMNQNQALKEQVKDSERKLRESNSAGPQSPAGTTGLREAQTECKNLRMQIHNLQQSGCSRNLVAKRLQEILVHLGSNKANTDSLPQWNDQLGKVLQQFQLQLTDVINSQQRRLIKQEKMEKKAENDIIDKLMSEISSLKMKLENQMNGGGSTDHTDGTDGSGTTGYNLSCRNRAILKSLSPQEQQLFNQLMNEIEQLRKLLQDRPSDHSNGRANGRVRDGELEKAIRNEMCNFPIYGPDRAQCNCPDVKTVDLFCNIMDHHLLEERIIKLKARRWELKHKRLLTLQDRQDEAICLQQTVEERTRNVNSLQKRLESLHKKCLNAQSKLDHSQKMQFNANKELKRLNNQADELQGELNRKKESVTKQSETLEVVKRNISEKEKCYSVLSKQIISLKEKMVEMSEVVAKLEIKHDKYETQLREGKEDVRRNEKLFRDGSLQLEENRRKLRECEAQQARQLAEWQQEVVERRKMLGESKNLLESKVTEQLKVLI